MPRVRAELRRFFFAEEASGRALWFCRGLAVWTGAYVLSQLPYLDELYCRPVLREGRFDRWFGPTIPPWPVIAAVVALLLAALALVAAGRGGRPARAAAAALFLVLVGAEASAPRAYAELAATQWIFAALMPDADPAAGGRAPRWATRLMMLQLTAVYVFAALSKLVEGTSWRTGDAVVLIFGSTRQGQHLLSAWWPLAAGPLARGLAWSTIGIELLIGIGLWFARTRAIAAVALVLLHLGIAATMRVSLLFHALMLLHLVLFVGPHSTGNGREMPGDREGRGSPAAG